ncbi:MAG: hypothetical protein A4E19_12480 [Nitrospira sp. SG-bin1]|nr:MAG: hypothetical protein A4E19_12480 [Nitrospira sp. SG-bin1]
MKPTAKTRHDMTARVLMLGIDAADLIFIQKHRDNLPVIDRLMREGVLRSLETTSRLLTGSVWPTFYTGTMPGEHGIYHHLQWDPTTMRIRRISADWLYCEPFWYELSRNGVKVTVADVPMTFPSRLQRGVEVVNWGAHDQLSRFHCNLPDLERDIRRRFGAHPMGAEIPVNKTRAQLENIRRHLIDGAKLKGGLIRHLLSNTEWDCFLAVFGECHRGGHILWPEDAPHSLIGEHALLDVYRAVDAAVGRILECVDLSATTVMLFSLHGMEKNSSQEHFVPPVMQLINSLFEGEVHLDGDPPTTQRSLLRQLRNRLPARIQNAIARAVPVSVRDWVISRVTSAGYDWKRTPALALLADHNGYLRFNLKGRETRGCLRADEDSFSRYREWLESGFRGLRIVTDHTPLVNELVWGAEAFPGRRADYLPDVIVTWNKHPPAAVVESKALGRITSRLDTGRSGNHRHEGFLLLCGPGQQHEGWASVKHIVNLAPQLLHQYLGPLAVDA